MAVDTSPVSCIALIAALRFGCSTTKSRRPAQNAGASWIGEQSLPATPAEAENGSNRRDVRTTIVDGTEHRRMHQSNSHMYKSTSEEDTLL